MDDNVFEDECLWLEHTEVYTEVFLSSAVNPEVYEGRLSPLMMGYFYAFLHNEGAYANYIGLLVDPADLGYEEFAYLFNEIMDWEDTPQGFEYWGRLDIKWRKLVQEVTDLPSLYNP